MSLLSRLRQLPGGGELLCLFNWGEQVKMVDVPAGGIDFWDERPQGEAIMLQGGQGRVIRYA